MKSIKKIAIVVPNWNGEKVIKDCLDSLLSQDTDHEFKIVVVENGSKDGSLNILKKYEDKIVVLKEPVNLGFAGGVNKGIAWSIANDYEFIALFNNDAVADKEWLNSLANELIKNNKYGIVTSKIIGPKGKIDSTGDFYTVWGLPYPRNRGESSELVSEPNNKEVFSASGGASLYRASMLKEIGLFDKSFFAYYEDVDISFRARLYGWVIAYNPKALVYHKIGHTSSKIKGFTTYQTMKNLPLLLWKNVPCSLMFKILPRFVLAYLSFFVSAFLRGQLAYAIKGFFVSVLLSPPATYHRIKNMIHKKISTKYLSSLIVYDLPPNADKLRTLRDKYLKMIKY